MEALVAQRKEERKEMDLENARMRRQLKYMKEMVEENEEVEAEHQRQLAAKAPFSGTGYSLTGDTAPPPLLADQPPARVDHMPGLEHTGILSGRPRQVGHHIHSTKSKHCNENSEDTNVLFRSF